MRRPLPLCLRLYWLFCKTKCRVEGESSLPARPQGTSVPSPQAFLSWRRASEAATPRQRETQEGLTATSGGCAQLDEEVTRRSTGTAHAPRGVPRQQSSPSSEGWLAPLCCTATRVTVNLNGPPAQGAGVGARGRPPAFPTLAPPPSPPSCVPRCLTQAPHSLVDSW